MILAYDRDGRLRVADANLTRAGVDRYRGSEISGWRRLGLDPSAHYRMLRDGGELARAAKSFNGVPVLAHHKNHLPRPVDIIGTTGTDARFEAPFIRNSLHVWTKAAISGVESGDKREISAEYAYDADMTAGTFRGASYDGIMRNIRARNVALVPRARSGRSMAIVGDARRGPIRITENRRPQWESRI
jgi:hypothetical protein